MLFIVLAPFILALFCPLIFRWQFKWLGWIVSLLPALLFALLLCQAPLIMHGDTIKTSIPWIPDFDVFFSFYLDGLSLLFALLITGIGTLIVIYSGTYLEKNPRLGRYYAYLFLFMGAMLGTVLSSNLITLFIFWELTSLSSYLLISFNNEAKPARRAAMQGLLITVAGGLAMLTGFLIIGATLKHFSIPWLLDHPLSSAINPFYSAIALLVLAGALTKSAQFPFHFWLPNAMEAPTPVSAYLHSATMVKLGIYLIARFTPILGHSALWTNTLLGFGSITMIVGAVLSLRATDLKLILAYSTIMALGLLVFLLASGTPELTEAAMAFLIAHALYKAGLFLSVGIIDKTTGTRELPQLGGLSSYLPITFVAVLLCAISMCGLPPVFGFISKEAIYTAKLGSSGPHALLIFAVILTNIVFVTIAFLVAVKPFCTKPSASFKLQSFKLPGKIFSLWSAPLLLGILGLLLGLHPWLVDGRIIAPAVSSVVSKPILTELHLWHGVSPALLLSASTFIFGILLYFAYKGVHHYLKNLKWIEHFSPESLYQASLRGLNKLASATAVVIQPGLLRTYTSTIFLVMGSLSCFTFYYFKHLPATSIIPHAPWFGWIIAGIMFVAGLATILSAAYLAALAFLGVIGLGLTLIFLIYSAPDVAMAQLLVDVLTIVIVVLALYRLPSLPKHKHSPKKLFLFNLVISMLVGLTITLILLSILSTPLHLFVNNFYSKYSFSIAHGRNIVNVILVDFRAFDTLGEIIVVAIAGLGVYGLLKTPTRSRRKQ